MANLTLASVTLPSSVSGPGVPAAPYTNPTPNGGAVAFSGGSTGADTITNAALLAILPEGAFKSLASTTFASAADFDKALAMFRLQFSAIAGASAINPNLVANKLTFDVTTTAGTGLLIIAVTPSIAL
jgi:hypothetical protein